MILIEVSICYFLGFFLLLLSTFFFRVSDKLFFRLVFSSVSALFLFFILGALGFKPLPLLPFNASIIGFFGLLGAAAIIILNLAF